ncbi:MAG: hypothetical protein ABI895_03950 [Deltaproteobacteria bacterium]
MSERGSACGSAESRGSCHGAGRWALGCALLWLCACSGATDVVGVIDPDVGDPEVTEVERATPGSSAGTSNPAGFAGLDGSELLVVAGLPLRDYPGLTFDWPLGVRLRAFFAEASWGRSGPPAYVEREAFERMGPFISEQRREDVRFVASTGDIAERLRALFNDARSRFGSEPRSLVTRDAWSDEYLVVLGAASCEHSSNHHDDPCADLGSFTDGNSNDGSSDRASFEAP